MKRKLSYPPLQMIDDNNDALTAQELHDQMLAKALQEEEDAKLAASYADPSMEGFNQSSVAEPSPRKQKKAKKGLSWGDNAMGFEGKATRLTTEVFVRPGLKDPPPAPLLKDPPAPPAT